MSRPTYGLAPQFVLKTIIKRLGEKSTALFYNRVKITIWRTGLLPNRPLRLNIKQGTSDVGILSRPIMLVELRHRVPYVHFKQGDCLQSNFTHKKCITTLWLTAILWILIKNMLQIYQMWSFYQLLFGAIDILHNLSVQGVYTTTILKWFEWFRPLMNLTEISCWIACVPNFV